MTAPTVETLAGYVDAVARDATTSRPWLYDDARQEGLLAAWEALRDGKARDLLPYAKTAARNAISDAVVRQRSTGSERREGGYSGVIREADTTGLVVEGEHGPMLVADPADPSAELAVEQATARADYAAPVREAVRTLDPADRLYVFLRFWEDRTAREIGEALGISADAAAHRWHSRIRPRLRADLAAA